MAPTRFHCPLAEAGVADDDTGEERRALVANPAFWYQMGPTIPRDLLHRAPHRGRFLAGYPIVWVEEPGTGSLNPYWAPRTWARELSAVTPGRPAPESLTREAVHGLRRARVLVHEDELTELRDERAAALADAAAEFGARGYTNVRGLLPHAEVTALSSYFRRRISSGEVDLGDPQCERRYGIHGEGVARFFHHQLTSQIERIVGRPIKPSYVYVASYVSGARLDPHTDREQCEYTVSLLVDYTAPRDGPAGWPLHLHAGDDVSLAQRVGDCALFRGRDLPHWRNPLDEGCTSTSILLHYVPAEFSGPLR